MDELENIFRQNHIKSDGKLIADNIAAIYKHCGNKHDKRFCEVYNETQDSYNLTEEETQYLERVIDEHLKKKYNLELVSKDMKSKVEVKKSNEL
ncbi:MAG: hypothetical protein HFI49_05275 [Bacilli bacterium]|jgi:hypothetical protein|nr:hypothetical protein [Lawsonibacter sp.]MCI9281644.1 hypothetical protein [Bacilli bacterium]